MLMYPSYVYVPFSRGAREVYTYIYDNAYVYINIYILITFSSVPWIHNHFSHHHHSRVCLRDVSHRRDRSLQAAECFSGSPPAQGRPRWLVWISGDRRVRPERRNHGEEGEESKMSIDERENKCFDWRKRERDLTDWLTDWLTWNHPSTKIPLMCVSSWSSSASPAASTILHPSGKGR